MSSLKQFQRQNLKSIGERPKKIFGQNFLISEHIIQKMITAGDIERQDIVVEVGPGLGVLTIEIAKMAKKVFAIEKDKKIYLALEKILKEQGIENIEIINKDILDIVSEIKEIVKEDYKVISNMPFYLTNHLIMELLENKTPPKSIVLMVQKEVAQRILAKPGSSNKLSIFCQLLSVPKIISYVKKESFWPKPKVDSAIIKLIPKKIGSDINMENFSKIIKAGFSQPRKTILNNFSCFFKKPKNLISKWLLENNVDENKRPENLFQEQWIKLSKSFFHIS